MSSPSSGVKPIPRSERPLTVKQQKFLDNQGLSERYARMIQRGHEFQLGATVLVSPELSPFEPWFWRMLVELHAAGLALKPHRFAYLLVAMRKKGLLATPRYSPMPDVFTRGELGYLNSLYEKEGISLDRGLACLPQFQEIASRLRARYGKTWTDREIFHALLDMRREGRLATVGRGKRRPEGGGLFGPLN
jgi:hypothetical protein